MPVYTMISSAGEIDRCQFCNMELVDEAPSVSSINLGRVYVVEDTALLREMIKDIMIVRGLAEDVQVCENGAEFLTSYTRDILMKRPPGLVMLDVVMPILNGINAAVAARSVEKAFGDRKTPLLFFTVKQCDDSFRRLLNYSAPAMYINKGRESSPDKMRSRVEAVISRLWKEMLEGE